MSHSEDGKVHIWRLEMVWWMVIGHDDEQEDKDDNGQLGVP